MDSDMEDDDRKCVKNELLCFVSNYVWQGQNTISTYMKSRVRVSTADPRWTAKM